MNQPTQKPALAFIDLRRKYREGEDTSSLSLNGRTNTPGFVQVVGGLNHCIEFAPRTEAARLAMIAWLESDECKAVARQPVAP